MRGAIFKSYFQKVISIILVVAILVPYPAGLHLALADPPAANDPAMNRLMERLAACRDLPVCVQSASARANQGPYRGTDNPCQFTPEELQQLQEWLVHLRDRGYWGLRGWLAVYRSDIAVSGALVLMLGLMASMLTSDHANEWHGLGVIPAVILMIYGSDTFHYTGWRPNSLAAQGISPREALQRVQNPSSPSSWYWRALRRFGAARNRAMRPLRNAAQRIAASRRALAERLERAEQLRQERAAEQFRNNVLRPHQRGQAAQMSPPQLQETRVRVELEQDPANPQAQRMCVSQSTVEEAAEALEAALVEAAAAEQGAQLGASAASGSRDSSPRTSQATTSHSCSPERVQQYAISLAVDRATRWHQFKQRQRRDAVLTDLVEVERFQRAQRAELLQGGFGVAGAVVGGVMVCASGGSATPAAVAAQQLFERAAMTAATAMALAAGTISLVPADASAQELAQAQQNCGLNFSRVSLPQSHAPITDGQAYIGIPATVVTERQSSLASYDPLRTPLCWVPAVTACAALRQEFANRNIAQLTPGICGSAAMQRSPSVAAPPNSSQPSQSIGAY